MAGSVKDIWKLLAVAALLFAACGPAAQATSTPARQAPTATPVAAATATPQKPPPGGGATPAPSPTPAPTAVAAAGPRSGGVLRNLFRNDPEDWDPHKALGGATPLRQSTAAVFSPLFTSDWPDPGKCETPPVPILAETWKWANDTTFEVKIHDGVRFHNKPPVNGRQLTAQDVAYSIERLRKEATYIKSLTDQIAGVQVVDPLTVRITTKGPLPGLYSAVLASYYGAEVILAKESGGPEELWRDPEKNWIGSGPFMFQKQQMGVKISMVRNPNYFKKGLPYVDGMEFLVVQDLGTRISLIRSGKLDALPQLPIISIDELQKTAPNIRTLGCPASAALMWLHIRVDKAPWNDVRVRRAVSMAIDQQSMIDSVLRGKGAWSGTVPPSHLWSLKKADYPPEVRQYLEYNPEGAKRLLAEAGFPSGLKAVLTAPRYWGSPWNELIEMSVSMFEKAGIKTETRWQERAVFASTSQMGDYPDITWRKLGAYDIYSYEVRFHSRNNFNENRSHVVDPELDKLIAEVTTTTDEAKQKALLRELQVRKASQAYVVLAPAPLYFWAFAPNVMGVGGSPDSDPTQSLRLYEKVWLQ